MPASKPQPLGPVCETGAGVELMGGSVTAGKGADPLSLGPAALIRATNSHHDGQSLLLAQTTTAPSNEAAQRCAVLGLGGDLVDGAEISPAIALLARRFFLLERP